MGMIWLFPLLLFFFSRSRIEIAAKSILASEVTELSDTTDVAAEKVVSLMDTTLAVASRPKVRIDLTVMSEHKSVYGAPFSGLEILTVCV